MNITRWLFSINLVIGLFWLIGFILEPIIQKEPSTIILSTLSILVSFLVSLFLFRLIPDFLKPVPDSFISNTKYYILSIIVSYFLLVPIFALMSYLIVVFWGNIHHNESNIFIALFSIWMPLWWFVPVGLSIGWTIYRRKCSL